ncbi:MAG TPA: hypothetical protein VFQ60_01405 [Patescibacteria group bacterium]|nr:hypothetical protein [Patescibacteria group bacterium]
MRYIVTKGPWPNEFEKNFNGKVEFNVIPTCTNLGHPHLHEEERLPVVIRRISGDRGNVRDKNGADYYLHGEVYPTKEPCFLLLRYFIKPNASPIVTGYAEIPDWPEHSYHSGT